MNQILEYYVNSAAFTSANPTSETHQILYLFLGILKKTNNFFKKKWDFLICIFFSSILNFLHLFFTAVQLQNYFYVHCQSYDRNLLIWTYTRNIIIYLQIIYPCIFNQSINQSRLVYPYVSFLQLWYLLPFSTSMLSFENLPTPYCRHQS